MNARHGDRLQELHALIVAQLTGAISDSQHLRLEQMLNDDAGNRRMYVEVMHDASLLHHVLHLAESPWASERREVNLRQFLRNATPMRFSVAVAVLVIGLVLTMMYFNAAPNFRRAARQEAEPPVIVARLTGVHQAVWAEEQLSLQAGAPLAAGRPLELQRGLAEVTLENGAVVTLQGPCRFTLTDHRTVTLQHGALSAWVGKWGRGFAVATPSAKVVDFGTEFGIEVEDDGATLVQVFQGEVHLESVHGGEQNRLTSGMRARTAVDGQIVLLREQPAPKFVRHLPHFDDRATGETIAYLVARGAPGSQDFDGALGHDFIVIRPIEVTRLGVYDNGADGLLRTITAELWRRDESGAPNEPPGPRKIAAMPFTPEDAGQLSGSSRFKLLDEPLVFAPGDYTIVAHGYGPGELASNDGVDFTAPQFKSRRSGQGAIHFVNNSRFGIAGEFPKRPDGGQNPQRYAAGTFAFRVCAEARPQK